MCPYFILLRMVRRPKSFIFFISFLCTFLFSWFTHAKEMKKIKTPHFSIGFDQSITKEAQRVANVLETLYRPVSKTLGIHPLPIRLLFNSQSALPNGSLDHLLPPYMSFYSFYSSDPYFVGNIDWLSFLSIHEFRHVVQLRTQYCSTPFFLLPFYFWANVAAVAGMPLFFSEGDAVGIETALSKNGRGRLPAWEALYKVNLLERGKASFSKQLFGSFQHAVPDKYRLGYYFTTHIRRKYGAGSIAAIYKETMSGLPYVGFYNAIKKVAKKPILKVYEDMNHELLLGWQKQLEGLTITPAKQLIIKRPTDLFCYTNPFMDASGNLIAWKRGIGVRHQLVLFRPYSASKASTKSQKMPLSFREGKRLFFANEHLPASLAIGEGCAAWLEKIRHPWRSKLDEGEATIRLQYYDFKRKKRKTLVRDSKYSALAMSPNTSQLVTVEPDDSGRYHLVVLETRSGKVIKKIPNPDDGYYLTPSWCDEDHVVVVKTKDQQNSILRINIHTNTTEILLSASCEHRNSPRIYKDYLLYNSSYNGIDNIYAMHFPTKDCFQVTSRKYGAYLGMVDPSTDQLIFSDYTRNGMEIVAMPFDPLLWTRLEAVEDRSINYYEPLVRQEDNSDILTQVSDHLYPVTKYSFWKDSLVCKGMEVDVAHEQNSGGIAFKFVPVQLLSLQGNFTAIPYFYHLFNSNPLDRGKLDSHESFGLVRKNKTSELGLKIDYQTNYPILNACISVRKYAYFGYEDREFHDDWRKRLTVGIVFPYYFSLDTSEGKVSLETAATLELCNRTSAVNYYAQVHTFTINNSSTKSRRDIHPPWSQELSVRWKDKRTNQKGLFMKNCRGMLYFPGMGGHHYWSIALIRCDSPQICRPQISRFQMLRQMSRSQMLPRIPDDSSPCVFKHMLTYGFPLVYPDCGIPLIWFLKRVNIQGSYSADVAGRFLGGDDVHHQIGVQLDFLNKLFSISSLSFNTTLKFYFSQKRDSKWQFSFSPNFSLSPSI